MNAPHRDTGEFLTPDDFQRLAEFIEGYSGIRMPPSKKTMVEGRLRRRVRALELSGFHEYCRLLFSHQLLEQEFIHLIDAVSTNKTEFFREEQHFQLLVEQIVPNLLNGSGRGPDRPLKLWSAACSTGAEPYTLAMLLEDMRQRVGGFAFTIFATDICTEVLAKAKAAIYPEDMLDAVPMELRRRYFMRSRDSDAHTVRLVPAIRQAVRFGRLNLMDESYGMPLDMDVIFCRNILIYFERVRQHAVLERLCRHLRPGGYLFVGHSETTAGMDLPVRQIAPSAFVKQG